VVNAGSTRDAQRPAPDAAQSGVPIGYTLVLPPAWRRIPVRHGTGKAIKKILDDAFGRLPKQASTATVMPWRKEIEQRLGAAAKQARRSGGLDLYLPVTTMHGSVIPASFIVSEGSLGSVERVDPAEIIAYMCAGSDKYRPVTVDEAIGLRFEHTARPDPPRLQHGSRRVDYTLSVPGEPDRWLVVAFSTLGGGDPDDQYARLLVELFDAIMSTFRWQERQESG
jgi:hypothetical protein